MHTDKRNQLSGWLGLSPASWGKLNNFARYGLAVVAVGFLIWVLVNALYAIPGADDFCYGYGARLRGVFGNVANEYLTWGGRFSATVLMGAFAVSSDVLLGHTYLVPFSILLLNLLAARHLFHVLEIRNKVLFLFFFTLFIATFRMRDSMFWLAGAVTYGVACAFFLALIAEEYRVFAKGFAPSRLRILILSVASFFLSGLNETVMLAHIALLLSMCALCFVRKQGRVIAWVLVAAIIGGAISAAAPGNYLRPSQLTNHPGLFGAAWTALALLFTKYTVSFLVSLLLFRLGFSLFPVRQARSESGREVGVFAVFMFLALWASIFARVYVLDELGPERARTIDFMLINVGAFIIALQWSRGQATVVTRTQNALVLLVSGGLVLFALSLVALPAKTWGKWVSSTQSSMSLRQLMVDRFAQTRKGIGEAVVVDAYEQDDKPITFFGDIKPDPKEWENVCYAQYFQLKEVRTKSAQ